MAQDKKIKVFLLNQTFSFGHRSCATHGEEGAKHQIARSQKRHIATYNKYFGLRVHLELLTLRVGPPFRPSCFDWDRDLADEYGAFISGREDEVSFRIPRDCRYAIAANPLLDLALSGLASAVAVNLQNLGTLAASLDRELRKSDLDEPTSRQI